MNVRELSKLPGFTVVNEGDLEQKIMAPFCCDLLSIAMSKAPADCAWVTVMGNINTLAVATLTEAACVVLAEGTKLDSPALEKAKSEGINIFSTEMPIFEAALDIYRRINE